MLYNKNIGIIIGGNLEFMISVTFVEIYLERIRDLFDQRGIKNNLAIREDAIQGIHLPGATQVYVVSAAELLSFHRLGAMARATAATGMNADSSRSHSVFQITIQQRNIETGNITRIMNITISLIVSI